MRPPLVFSSILLALAVIGCRRDMMNQPRAKTFSQSDFFLNGTSARSLPAHVVARGAVNENDIFHTGLSNGILVTQLPMTLTPQLLSRGHERYDAFCAECHGRVGDGNGVVAQRGFPSPPSYHTGRLRQAPVGHFFDVMTNGYGVMASYASQVEAQDRWAIAAYLRALQLSQNAKANELPANEKEELEHTP